MDDLFLCPRCGALHMTRYDCPYPVWMDWTERRVDRAAMWEAVEARFDVPEFTPQICDDSQQCRDIVRANRRRFWHEAIKERLRRWAIQRAARVERATADAAATRAAKRKPEVETVATQVA